MTTTPSAMQNAYVSHAITMPVPEAASGASIDDMDTVGAGLTPDALMAYCQSRLDTIDNQVQSEFAQQNKNAQEISLLQTSGDLFKTLSAGDQHGSIDLNESAADQQVTDGKNNVQNMYNSLNNTIQEIMKTDPNSSVLPGLQNTLSLLKSSAADDATISQTEIQGYAQTITDAASSLNSNSELQMVQLQSLMSQRQTAISLTTNLVQSLGDESKVADNIGK
jgi:hypothetical protein